MAYTKHEWVTGEIITAANLNHIEDGIASKLDSESVVNRQDVGVPGSALDALQANPNVPGSLAAQIQEAGESSKAIVLTQAEYDALSDEEKDSDNVYYISDAPFESSNVVPLTRAQYDALSDATKMDGRFYYITDEAEVAKSLVVQNNVNSTETVPSSSLVYKGAKNIATIEDSNVASQAYSVGNFLILDGQLYRVTNAIAQGGTITVGTNVTLDSVGSELKSLNDSLLTHTSASGAQITVNSSYVSSSNLRWNRIGDVVMVGGWFRLSAVPPPDANIFKVPNSYHESVVFGYDQNAKNTVSLLLATSGDVRCVYSKFVVGNYINVGFTYITT